MDLGSEEVQRQVEVILQRFGDRHPNLENMLFQNAREAASRLQIQLPDDRPRQLLIGSCMSMEYAMEAAALFNPSMIESLDQSGLAQGERRFILSLRAVGEGHISSIVFRRGIVSADGQVRLIQPSKITRQMQPEPNPQYQKFHLERKLREMHKLDKAAQVILNSLGEMFNYHQLLATVDRLQSERTVGDIERAGQLIVWLVRSNYKTQIPHDLNLIDYVLFPISETESQGMEDMRLVRFVDDQQTVVGGTYTAFSGNKILPQMMLYRPGDKEMQVLTLQGEYAQGKGLALFPRKVNGKYLMLARCDGQNNFLLTSDEPDYWNQGSLLSEPQAAWEVVQVGNCGSPIETKQGWLTLTHGVGPMRRYCIGAILLDLENPARVIRRLETPLIEPQEEEIGGYVPNVVYSCGGMLFGDKLFIPYGISDAKCGFAWVSLEELLHAMKPT